MKDCFKNVPVVTFGAIAPVKAEDSWTGVVGVRDGQLYFSISDIGGTPLVTEADNGKILQVISGQWTPSDNIPNRLSTLEGSMISLDSDMQQVQLTLNEIYAGLQQINTTLNSINRTVIV